MTAAPSALTEAPAVHRRVVLAVVLSATFMQLVDISIVNTAIPSIQEDIAASIGQLQLIISGYTLAFACTLITAARLGDVRGRRTLFLAGMAVFTVASVLCGLAQSGDQLVAFRVVQGLGSGLMFPQVLSVIQVVFPPQERGKAFAAYGSTIGIATILGPLLGGVLIQLDLAGSTWRSVFFVNVPIGIAALAAAVRYLPQSRSDDAPRLDLPGAALVTVGLFLLVYPLAEGRSRGWPLWLLAMLAGAVPVLGAFWVLQVRKTRRNDSPLLLTSLFHQRAFSTGSALILVFFLGLPAFFFTLALYLQVGLGYTALHSGLTSFPFAVGAGLASARSDRLARRLGTRVLTLGTGLLVVSIGALILLVAARGAELHSWQAWPILLVAGLGLGCFIAPVTTLVLAGVDRNAAGSASGVLSTVQQVGWRARRRGGRDAVLHVRRQLGGGGGPGGGPVPAARAERRRDPGQPVRAGGRRVHRLLHPSGRLPRPAAGPGRLPVRVGAGSGGLPGRRRRDPRRDRPGPQGHVRPRLPADPGLAGAGVGAVVRAGPAAAEGATRGWARPAGGRLTQCRRTPSVIQHPG